MMKTNQNNHIMNMNKGMKQKLSMLLIACLLFTGYRGLTIPGRAEQGNTEQNNAISVSGTQVKVQLLGEDLRRAAKEAIEKGERVDDSVLKGYSKDEELQKSYAGIFSLDKEVYEIPLDSISEGLSESLAEEEAGLQVFVERDAQDLGNLVRKESKESLLLYDGKSQLEQLFPKGEETESVKKEEEENLASDSNMVRNTELTGSELITFLYKNKADHRITFQLSVDGNKYPKVTVSPKTQLFKELVDKLKKEEKKVPVETTKAPESKIEKSTEAKGVAPEEQLAESVTSSEEVKETAKQAASKEETTEASVTEASTQGSASKVSIVSEEKKEEASKQETSEAAVKAEEKNEESAEAETATEAPVKKESTKEVEVKFSGFLQDVISHYEEFLGELVSARFSQYSLNELGRKSQNVEIEGFATVEVFYDDEAFVDEEGKAQDVVLEAKRLVKPEEEGKKDGEKLTEEQVKAMKDQAIYDDSDALDIRFVSKADRTKEIEPKVPVSVRLTFDKKAVPEEATADTIAIHHIVEDKDSGKVKTVETVVRSEKEKNSGDDFSSSPTRDLAGLVPDSGEGDLKVTESKVNYISEVDSEEESANSQKNDITKEFTVASFSAYVVTWKDCKEIKYEIRFHYVDQNFREIGPTVYKNIIKNPDIAISPSEREIYYRVGELSKSTAYKEFENFKLSNVGGIAESDAKQWGLYIAMPEIKGVEVVHIDEDGAWLYFKDSKGTVTKREYHRFVRKCLYKDFFFIYKLTPETHISSEKKVKPLLTNEKFITDKQDGTYDLTLTGQVKQQNTKQKIDILFVYDNTAVMATGFNFNEKNKKLDSGDYETNIENAKSTKVKNELANFMKSMSNLTDVEARYALVTMDGDKYFGNINENVKGNYESSYLEGKDYKISAFKLGREPDPQNPGVNIVGDYKGTTAGGLEWLSKATDDEGKSHQFNVLDEENNDTKHVYGFTSNPTDIIKELNSLNEKDSKLIPKATKKISGENYASAMKNVRALMDGESYEVPGGGLKNESSKVRSDAEKIVVFIAGGNPKFATIQETGVYDDTHRFNDTDYYMIRRNYKKGWSYGNGYSINFAALNQARGELSKLKNVDAFYSIGVGNADNWKYLNDFAMGQGYDEEGKIIKVTENGVKDDFVKFHPDRRERALEEAPEEAPEEKIRYKCYDGSTETNLHTAFQGIYQRVARNQVRNIKITDILTKYVQPVPQNKTALTGQLVKMKANSNRNFSDVEVDHVLSAQEMKDMGLEGFEVDASKGYDSDYGREVWKLTLTTKPADFSLPPGYDIRMVAHIEPTEPAKKYLENNPNYTDIGEGRTDLNDIYKVYLGKEYTDPSGKPKSMFDTSAYKLGLYTNEKAEITHKVRKPDGSEVTPPAQNYNKPIINLKNTGFLQIKKIFWGVDNKIYNSSTGRWTELGKQILKNISFEIWQKESSDTRDEEGGRLLTTINLGDEDWINSDFKTDKVLKKNGFDLRIHAYERKDGADYFIFTIDNLPKNMRYKVVEKVANESKIYQENATDLLGYKFVGKGKDGKGKNGDRTELYNLLAGRDYFTYEFNNLYKQVDAPKSITIKKLVQEFGNTAVSNEARTDSFDFYMVLYKGNDAFSTQDVDKYLLNLDSGTRNLIAGSEMVSIKESGTTKTLSAIHFKLQHNNAISLPLDNGVKFQVFELKDKGYEKAKILNGGTASEMTVGNKTYTHTGKLDNSGQTITFQNPKITAIPTGLRGDITPYLFSIFGFTMMAGMYLTIRKRKRVEI